MNPPAIQLAYRYADQRQAGAGLEHPLFAMIGALQSAGSIKGAAQALGVSYRHVWGALRRWEAELGRPLVAWSQGRQARLTPYAQRLLWAERQARSRMQPHLEALRAELAQVFEAADDRRPALEVLASHDLALPRLQPLAAASGLSLGVHLAGSVEALRALRDGRCQVAVFHVPRLAPEGSPTFRRALRSLLEPGLHKLIGSHQRTQGLMWRRSMPEPSGLADVVARRLRFVQRPVGSGTRLLLEHLLHAQDLRPQQLDGDGDGGPVEPTHVAVAAAIAAGAADVGLGVHAAAHEFGLAFMPLAVEDSYFVCLRPALESPAVQQLRAVLASAAWADALVDLEGYAPQQAGQVLSLTRALPWWHLKPKAVRARRGVGAAAPVAGP